MLISSKHIWAFHKKNAQQSNSISPIFHLLCSMLCWIIPASVLIYEFQTKNEVNSPKRMLRYSYLTVLHTLEMTQIIGLNNEF